MFTLQNQCSRYRSIWPRNRVCVCYSSDRGVYWVVTAKPVSIAQGNNYSLCNLICKGFVRISRKYYHWYFLVTVHVLIVNKSKKKKTNKRWCVRFVFAAQETEIAFYDPEYLSFIYFMKTVVKTLPLNCLKELNNDIHLLHLGST